MPLGTAESVQSLNKNHLSESNVILSKEIYQVTNFYYSFIYFTPTEMTAKQFQSKEKM